jgi:hypothetical protein
MKSICAEERQAVALGYQRTGDRSKADNFLRKKMTKYFV